MKSQLFFEDVAEGQELPPLKKGPYTVMTMAMFASVSGDFYPSHYDNKWAIEKSHHKGALAHGLQVTCYLSQLVTDWITPDGMLKKFNSQNRNPTFDGDVLVFRGKVTQKQVRNGENCVGCEIWGEKNDGSIVVTGSAVVALPSRVSAAPQGRKA